MKYVWIGLASMLASHVASADWRLDNAASVLSFISIKKGNVAEVHRFRELSGTVSKDGEIDLKIDLSSADTGVAIRDQRLASMLFDVVDFPSARVTGDAGIDRIKSIAPEESISETVRVEVDLHGVKKVLDARLRVTRLGKDKLLVVSEAPIIINASDFNLSEGVEKLRAVVNLPSISEAVPVSFVLSFSAVP